MRTDTDTTFSSDRVSSLHLENITYIYPHDASDFSLSIESLSFYCGRTYFITGANGSGKTTLLRILMGLLDINQGQIRLDSQAITPNHQFTQLFSAVVDKSYVTTQIPYFINEDNTEVVNRMLKELDLIEKVSIQDGCFSTTHLSRGQLKRLALIVSHILDRPFMIFDEWACEQDPIYRDWFYSTYLPLLKSQNKMVFVISHDDRYYNTADQIIRIERGSIEVLDAS